MVSPLKRTSGRLKHQRRNLRTRSKISHSTLTGRPAGFTSPSAACLRDLHRTGSPKRVGLKIPVPTPASTSRPSRLPGHDHSPLPQSIHEAKKLKTALVNDSPMRPGAKLEPSVAQHHQFDHHPSLQPGAASRWSRPEPLEKPSTSPREHLGARHWKSRVKNAISAMKLFRA